MADMIYGSSSAVNSGGGVAGSFSGGGDLAEDSNTDYGYAGNYGMNNSFNNNQPRQRFPGLYVGNLTWWTTDKDVIEAINSIGVQDVQEVKFFENRNNGQSKGFCVVTFTSDASLPTVLEKLPKIEIHDQNPVVTPYNRQNLNLFESQTNKLQRPQGVQGGSLNPVNGNASAGIMGINSITGVHAAAAAAAAASGQLSFPGGLPNSGIVGAGGAGSFNNHAGGLGVPRPPYQMRMRGPRPMMRGSAPGMNNGPMIPGGPRIPRYTQPQWQNSQTGGYNPRMQTNMNDMSNRLSNSGASLKDDTGQGGEMSSYYNSHHSSSNHHHHHHQSDHYRGGREHSSSRDSHGASGRELRDDRDSGSRRLEGSYERSSRADDKGSLRHADDRSRGGDDRHTSKQEDRSERSSRRTSDRRHSSIRREDEGSDAARSSSRREDSKRDRDGDRDRSSRREERTSRRDRGRDRSEDDRRSRSRSRDKERSRRDRDRRDRY